MNVVNRLIMTPLAIEQKHLRSALQDKGLGFERVSLLQQSYDYCEKFKLALAIGGHGKTQFGIQSQFFCEHLKPQRLICVGAAGALSRNLKPPDVVVASRILEHDYHEKFRSPVSQPVFDCSPLANPGLKVRGFSVHFGTVASGDEDVVDPDRARELYIRTKALAVCWESAGGARASHFNGIEYMELRGITDNARSDVASDFKTNLPQAMKHCAEVLLHELMS